MRSVPAPLSTALECRLVRYAVPVLVPVPRAVTSISEGLEVLEQLDDVRNERGLLKSIKRVLRGDAARV